MPHRLNQQQVDTYQKEGFLLFADQVFSSVKFESLKAHFEKQLEVWTSDGRSPEHMDVPHFADPALFAWLFDDEVLDIVEPLIGPDIALFSSHFICKPAGVGKRVPWHEDSAYWKGRLDPMEVVTVWLAIDPSTPDNGCMRVIPGSHSGGFSDYDDVSQPDKEVFATEIRKGTFDENQAIDCVLKPNHCSLHNGRLIHGSNPNTGAMRRCGYTMRFISTDVKFITEGDRNEAFQIYLARGKDKANNHYGDPGKVNQKWLDRYPNGWPKGH